MSTFMTEVHEKFEKEDALKRGNRDPTKASFASGGTHGRGLPEGTNILTASGSNLLELGALSAVDEE